MEQLNKQLALETPKFNKLLDENSKIEAEETMQHFLNQYMQKDQNEIIN